MQDIRPCFLRQDCELVTSIHFVKNWANFSKTVGFNPRLACLSQVFGLMQNPLGMSSAQLGLPYSLIQITSC